MAETKLTRDHHLLTRNLKLNGNYISNDGGTAGLRINDDGLVTANANLIVDTNYDSATASTITALHIDVDKTGAVSSGTDTVSGIDLDVTHTGANSGIIYSVGLDVDVVGDTAGTSYNQGINIKTLGADNNRGIYINNVDSGGINHYTNDFTNVSSASTIDYFSINTIEDGETTLETHEEVGSTAHLHINVDGDFDVDAVGDITLDAGGGDVNILQADVTIPVDKKVIFGNTGEYIAGDGTDLDIVSSRDLNIGTTAGALKLTGRAEITLLDTATTTVTNKGIFLDLNSTGDLTSGDQILTNIGIDIDIDRAGTTSHGSATVNQTGVYINVLGEGDGVAINEGISIITSGADTNYGVIIKDWADTGDFFHISTTTNGATTIGTVDDDGNDDADLNIDIDGKITLDSNTGEFVMKAAGSIAEFSVANSAYAGMILGYTTVGIDAASDSYVLSATMTVLDDAMKVKFVAPPSGVVEIFAQIYFDASRRSPVLGLSDANATTGYSAIDFPNANDVTNEHIQATPPSSVGDSMLRPHWVVTGLTAGTAYEWWFAARTSLSIGGVLRWGGTVGNQYPPFIMRATALPVAVTDYAVYS